MSFLTVFRLLNSTAEVQRTISTAINIETTAEFSEIVSSSDNIVIHALPQSVIYIIVSFVVIFGLFVGTYIYKHCIQKRGNSTTNDITQLSYQEEYNHLYQDTPHQRMDCADLVYLDPVCSPNAEETNNGD